MCIIAIKKRGIKFPSEKTMQNMMEQNPDGFSLIVSEGEGVSTRRTLNSAEMLEYYKYLTENFDYKTTSMIFHARIKTHGSMKLENCHGWKDEEIGMAFAHNGILSISNRGDMTDSETFFRDIFVPVFKEGGWKTAKLAVNAIIGTSKFAFLDNDGVIYHFGQYIEDGSGMLYSNSTYLDPKPYFPYGYAGGYCYDDYGYGDDDGCCYSKSKTTRTVATEKKRIPNHVYSYRDKITYYDTEFGSDWPLVYKELIKENQQIVSKTKVRY